MKKQVCFLIALLIAICVFVSCNESTINETTSADITESSNASETPDQSHVHSWSSWMTISDASCLTEGKQERTCDCGEKESQVLPAEGHTEIIDSAVAATCATKGKTEGKHCSVCNEIIVEQTSTNKLDHTESDWIIGKEATCSASGTKHKKCTVCATVLQTQSIPQLSHIESDWIIDKESTCSTNGTQCKICTLCERVLKTQTINKTAHTEGDWKITKEATCTTSGTQQQICTVCGKVVKTQSISKAKHIESDWIIDKEATCKTQGSKHQECIYCGKKIRSASVGKNPDNHIEVIDAYVAPTCLSAGLTEGKHCSECNKITVEQTKIPNLNHIGTDVCTVCGENLIIPDDVWSEIGCITTEDTVIETKYFELHIPANIYVPADLVENLDLIGETMEKVSGLTSAGNPHYQRGTAKTPITVFKPNNPNDPDAEVSGTGVGGGSSGATICSYDIVYVSALIHEAAHVFQYRQSNWSYCTWAMESISTYTTYKVQKYFEDNYPNLAIYTGTSSNSIYNMRITNYSKLYEHTMDYWAENKFEYSKNSNYAIGFRLAWYLDEVYGDYTKWIYTYEELYPYYNKDKKIVGNKLSIEEQLQAFKLAYGEDVFDNFYTWLQSNENLFQTKDKSDIHTTHNIDLYPKFTAGTTKGYKLPYKSCEYSELYINLQPGKYYLSEYKNKNIDKLELTVSGGVTMSFYDSVGEIIKTVTSVGNYETFDISEVDFIKLVGNGILKTYQIVLENGKKTSGIFKISGWE